MRIAASHHLAAVLKDLHVVEPIATTQLDILVRPNVHHSTYIRRVHACERKAVVRGKADHPAQSALTTVGQQSAVSTFARRRVRAHGRKVVLEDERMLVLRIPHTARARVSWAQVALRIIASPRRLWEFLHLALPGPGRAVR